MYIVYSYTVLICVRLFPWSCSAIIYKRGCNVTNLNVKYYFKLNDVCRSITRYNNWGIIYCRWRRHYVYHHLDVCIGIDFVVCIMYIQNSNRHRCHQHRISCLLQYRLADRRTFWTISKVMQRNDLKKIKTYTWKVAYERSFFYQNWQVWFIGIGYFIYRKISKY